VSEYHEGVIHRMTQERNELLAIVRGLREQLAEREAQLAAHAMQCPQCQAAALDAVGLSLKGGDGSVSLGRDIDDRHDHKSCSFLNL
jgi:hypothetical protein